MGSEPTEQTTTSAPAGQWMGKDGGIDRACRGANKRDNSKTYYQLHKMVDSMETCRALCKSAASCKGIEYNENGKRCDVWTRDIEASKKVAGFECWVFTADASP